MRDLNHDLKKICRRNRDGSFGTRADRERILNLAANQLAEGGFRNLRAQGLRTKHVEHLVQRWHGEAISAGTFKNRMSALRWVAEKIDKQNIVERENAAYGIAERRYVTNVSKARELDAQLLAGVTDPGSALSLRLQEAFGLRREESIKLRPAWADRGDVLHLLGSWTKGGKERDIPICTPAQRELLKQAKEFAGAGSLIPAEMSYKEQLNRFKTQTARAGIHRVHGLRHRYAQKRYEDLTGWKAPAAGGASSKQLTPEQKLIDRQVRLTISRELGHEREQITAVYLGR
jgi:site-specific recombinase XerC